VVNDSNQQSKQQVTITLPDASYEPAAMAVLAELYHVKTLVQAAGNAAHRARS
jgi:hypothetical protein